MRIITGKYKGKRIHPGKDFKARPTTDFAKEGIFNVISNYFDIKELTVLDLFAGTGSISFEFASRGCQKIDAVEKDRIHSCFIHQIAMELSLNQINTIRSDALRFIKNCKKKYSIIFADPPYDFEYLADIPSFIISHSLIKPEGWLILEHSRYYDFTSSDYFFDHKKYGNVHFSIFKV